MMIIKRGLTFVSCKTCQLARFSTVTTNYEGLLQQPKFSSEEQGKILEVLNKSNTEQLSRFDVSQSRIKNLEVWRNKKGPFKSLADVLEVDGLGVKVLERLCESIVQDNQKHDKSGQTNNGKLSNNGKNRKQYLTPILDNDRINNLNSAVGLHLGPAGISWTRIAREQNCLNEWGFYDFSTFPKKMLPTDTFQLAITILDKIPVSDIYLFEASPSISMQSTKQAAVMTSYNQQQELTSMLLALINTSPKHAFQPTQNEISHRNNVFFLRSNLSARLFKTLMGTERVSSTTAVSNLLEHAKNSVNHNLPCNSIKAEGHIIEQYYSQSSVVKELLGQSLLLIITFMELCIYKNPTALGAVLPRRK
ncbi:hypothetical protein ILUMI_22214 [Ignelater luminosus]|uniref:Transcription elongation factor, mitochondrial n=1 Tax=Ignelater luminosus TaxID=2038154 RepID=A0A8K0CE95_IGNLU|nr:hypothetical protein ILUMI_22214 [Ignelater luminosus]